MKLETKIRQLIAETNPTAETRFDVIAHELMHDGEGWSTNTSWYLRRDADIAETLEAARGRWEVFKANYHSKARVRDITDPSCGCWETLHLDVDCIPFLEIRLAV